MVYNQAPTAPSSISVPSEVIGGENLVISWGPVSYTHLDVYKRQILICLTGEMFLYSGMAVREHSEDRHIMGTDEDVYKRQAKKQRAKIPKPKIPYIRPHRRR